MKASFFERVVAYIIDIIIISAAVTIVTVVIPSSNTDDLQKQLSDINESYIDGDLSVTDYMDEISGLYYQLDKETMLVTIITVFALMMYFMYYQFKNDGQTIGKRLMKIKIVKTEGKLELNDLVVRSLLIDNILYSMIVLLLIFVTNESNYFITKSSLELVQLSFIVIASFMVLFRNDKRGLHDLICKTKVISCREEEQV